jgi:hypothetical protein
MTLLTRNPYNFSILPVYLHKGCSQIARRSTNSKALLINHQQVLGNGKQPLESPKFNVVALMVCATEK